MNSKIFSLRKSKMGLVSVAIAFLWIGTGMNMETAMAEETDATALETQLESKESSLTNTVSENAEAEEVTDEVPSEEKKSEEMEDMEEELPFIENHLEVAPIQAGDQTISGNTTPGGYVAITIDGEAITSIENILEADDKGDFSYRLSKPLAHSQTVEISALPKQFWTLEADSEERKVVVRTNRHPEAYEIPAKRLEKTSNGMHQVFIEPVFEHTSKVIGHTSVKGSVYLSINGSFV
ncbi:YSIRK-type signal peptide-containing protein, partial [Streptococcus suis]